MQSRRRARSRTIGTIVDADQIAARKPQIAAGHQIIAIAIGNINGLRIHACNNVITTRQIIFIHRCGRGRANGVIVDGRDRHVINNGDAKCLTDCCGRQINRIAIPIDNFNTVFNGARQTESQIGLVFALGGIVINIALQIKRIGSVRIQRDGKDSLAPRTGGQDIANLIIGNRNPIGGQIRRPRNGVVKITIGQRGSARCGVRIRPCIDREQIFANQPKIAGCRRRIGAISAPRRIVFIDRDGGGKAGRVAHCQNWHIIDNIHLNDIRYRCAIAIRQRNSKGQIVNDILTCTVWMIQIANQIEGPAETRGFITSDRYGEDSRTASTRSRGQNVTI